MSKARILIWAGRLSVLLAALLVLIVLLAGAVLVFLDSDDSKKILAWGADHYLDASLQINGKFSLSLGRETILVGEQVLLRAHDGSYSVSAGKIRLAQRLGSYLMTGTLWLNSLEVSDLQLSLQGQDDHEFSLAGETLPPVVIEQALFHNLHANYRQVDGKVQELALLDLVIDDVNDSGPLGVRGEGMLNGQPLEVEGNLGALATLLGAEPYPVSLTVSSQSLVAGFSGSIADPVRGKGMDLSLSVTDPRLSKTLRLIDSTVPEVGALAAQARLRGDYDAPRLEGIDIKLQRNAGLGITITGMVENLLTGEGLVLAIDGQCSDPKVLAWSDFAKREGVETITGSGSVREQNGLFLLSAVNVTARTARGLKVRVSGTTTIPTQRRPRPVKSPALRVDFSMPSLKALNIDELNTFPLPGRVNGNASLRPYRDGSGVSDISVQAGDDKGMNITLSGAIGFVPYASAQEMTDIALHFGMTAPETMDIGRLIGNELPELGSVNLQMRVTGDSKNLAIDDISMTVGTPAEPAIRASGNMDTNLPRNTSLLHLDLDINASDLVTALGRPVSGHLGHLRGTLSASNAGGTWRLDSFNVNSTQTSLYTLRFSGAVDDIFKRTAAEIDLVMNVPDPSALGKAVDIGLDIHTAYHGSGKLSFRNKQVNYKGRGVLGKTTSTTQLSGSLAGDKPVLKGRFVIPVLYLSDFGLDSEAVQKVDQAGHAKTRKKSRIPRQYVFSREPLDLSWLGKLNLDLEIDIDRIDSREINARQLYGHVVLDDKQLRISPMRLIAEGGPTDLELQIDARSTPVVSINLSANDQQLGHWIAQIQNDIPVDGYTTYELDVRGKGNSPHELVSGLNGSVGLALENARIPREYVEYLSVDVFGWVLNKASRKEHYSDINCVLAEFEIKDGIMSSTLLASDGPHLSIEGKMTLDFADETIDAVFLPKQKKTMFSDITPVKITGRMQDPDIHAIPAKEAVTRIGALILVPYVAIPVTLLGKLWDSINDKDNYGGGCAKLKAKMDSGAMKTSNHETAELTDTFR